MKDFERLAEEEKSRIKHIRERIKSLTEQIQQRKNGISTQLLDIKLKPYSVEGTSTISPSLFSEIQNILLETITKGYETIIQEKEKVIQRLQKEIDTVVEKYQQLKQTQEQQIARVSILSEQQDKSVVELLKKIAEVESENRILKNKILELQQQTDKLETAAKHDRIEYVISHMRLLSDTIKECLRYFRTPIGMLNEAFELIKDDINGHFAHKKFSLIQQEIFKIRDILTSVVDRLKFPEDLTLQKVDLRNVISVVLSKFQAEFIAKNIQISQQVNTDKFFVTGNFQILVDCLSEIIMNSIESFFQPIGNQIIIKIEDNNNFPKLIIEDNGCGIPEHLLTKVFKLFFTTKFEQGHYGIGLFKVQWYLKMFDARITIYSVFNRGTSVTIEFTQ